MLFKSVAETVLMYLALFGLAGLATYSELLFLYVLGGERHEGG